MRKLHLPICTFILGLSMVVWVGCAPKDSATTADSTTAGDHDHEGDHDHDDGHDHDDDHDHGDHKEGDHDHADDKKAEGDDHAHGEHGDDDGHSHDSLPEAMKKFGELQAEIAVKLSGDDPKSADTQLHELYDVLSAVGGLIDKSELGDEAKSTAKDAIKNLLDRYTEVDQKLHDKEGKDYADVKEAIESAVKTLTETVK